MSLKPRVSLWQKYSKSEGCNRVSAIVAGYLARRRTIGPRHILERDLERLDLEPDRAVAGRLETDRHQRQDRVGITPVDALAGHAQHVLDHQHRLHPLGRVALAALILPPETVEQQAKAPLSRAPCHFGDRKDRILRERGNHLQIIDIERTQIERCLAPVFEFGVFGHWPLILSIFAPTLPSFSSTLSYPRSR